MAASHQGLLLLAEFEKPDIDVTAIKYGYGKSPVPGMPVAGWLDYDFPVVRPSGC